jgi:cytochrome c oxidase cbb3-type subunit 3
MAASRSLVFVFAGTVFIAALVVAFGTGCEKKADAAQGQNLFATTCARCHGPDGTGGDPLAEGGPPARNFHDRAFQAARTDEQIKLTIMNGKGTGMPAFGTAFDGAQLNALVAHVRSFDHATGAK